MKKHLLQSICLGIIVGAVTLLSRNYDVKADSAICQNENDAVVIPDKYNTGIDKDATLEKVVPGSTYGGVKFSQASNGYLIVNFYSNRDLSGTVVLENLDFSSNHFAVYNENVLDSQLTIVFRNCKFSFISTGKLLNNLSFEFDHCEIVRFDGSNAVLNRCHFTKGGTDGIVPFRNVYVNDCFISDKCNIGKTTETVHIDGTQIFGMKDAASGNIHYSNCRFEIPQLKNATSKAYVNACIMLQIEYGDCDDVSFDNCYVNGGGYTIYACSTNDHSLTNVVFNNISIGTVAKYGDVYRQNFEENVVLNNLYKTSSLYVGSIWDDYSGKHISVSNDTNERRELLVCTNNGNYTYTINACTRHDEITEGMTYDSFPFDIDINIGYGVDWIVCYDITDGNMNQIRFENATGNEIMLNDEGIHYEAFQAASSATIDTELEKANNRLAAAVIEEKEVIGTDGLSGECGRNVFWTLEDGVLTLTGTGSTYNYNSKKPAPWSEYKDEIFMIVINDGITRIGEQVFLGCKKITSVEIPNSVTELGKNAFIHCSELVSVKLSDNIKSIGQMCFWNTKLESVEFNGDASEVIIGSHNNSLVTLLQ